MPVKIELSTPIPIKIWTNDVEPEARRQLTKLGSLPILFSHVAVMPDVHSGRGSTIGTVLASRGAIIPAAVGVDIGCGMMALQTDLPIARVRDKLSLIRAHIESQIPLGFDQNKSISPHIRNFELWSHWNKLTPLVGGDARLREKALAQCGSLGGGNHFIEVCGDESERVWLLLHSGSRNIGKVLADVHIHEARRVIQEASIAVPDPDLSYLLQGTPEFKSYVHDLLWAQAYARANREEMMQRLAAIMGQLCGEFTVGQKVNCHHNYAQEEDHFGQRVWITRKGAVSARAGEWGIVPGSMGTKSFIVKGRGNPLSFESCAHGAGRRMSRTQAKKLFSQEDLRDQTQGVECRKDKNVLDEIPAAYKNIDEVMKDQSDLVEVLHQLKQVVCVKG